MGKLEKGQCQIMGALGGNWYLQKGDNGEAYDSRAGGRDLTLSEVLSNYFKEIEKFAAEHPNIEIDFSDDINVHVYHHYDEQKGLPVKDIKIPEELFFKLVQYHVCGIENDQIKQEIEQGIENKLEKIVNHELYTKSKVSGTDEEKQKFYKEYLTRTKRAAE